MSNTTSAHPQQSMTESTVLDQVEELVIYVCNGFSGVISRAVVRPELSIIELIPEIADQIGYSSPDWEKIGLYNLTRDFEYDIDDIMVSTATVQGDLIIMAVSSQVRPTPDSTPSTVGLWCSARPINRLYE